MLVHATVEHSMFSFMDGFSDCNQNKMDPNDSEKTTFRTPMGNFHYTIMLFGLKNVGANYQGAINAIFHHMLHDYVEDYVNDIIVTFKEVSQHVDDLRKNLATMQTL